MIFSYWLVQIVLEVAFLTACDIFLLVGPNDHTSGSSYYYLLFSYKLVHIILEVGQLITCDIFLLLGPNNLRSGSTYYK